MSTDTGAGARRRALEPTELAGVPLRNRIFVSAHTTNFAESFRATGRHVEYHRARARGGVGLIITEPLRVHESSLGRAGGLSADPESLPVLTALTEAVRAEGAAVFTQLTHAGRHSDNSTRRSASWGPSAVPFTVTGPVPHAMTRADLVTVRQSYVAAARLARQAGFQGVEIHFGHGHLLHQFLSPASNTRTDAHGGSEEARLRFPFEVLQDVLDAVGDDLVVGVRMSADELLPGGQDLDLGRRIAARVDATDGVGFLNVSVASYTVPSIGHHVADMSEGRTPYLNESVAAARECRRLPVLMACRVVDLDDADRVLETGVFTAVAMTRAHIADPDVVRNALAGREDRTRPCVSCNYCIDQIGKDRALTCAVNPTVGREAEWPAVAVVAEQPRSVLVVGAGPAGLEAARVAAERGHRVQVWERAERIGGQLLTGRAGHGRGELDLLRSWEERRLAELGVSLRTGHEATVDEIVASAPDVVVIATGARRRRETVPGWGPTVPVELALSTADWSGRTVLVEDHTGAWAALSVAESVAARGGRVHLSTPATTPLWSVPEYSRMTAVERLQRAEVSIHLARRVRFVGGAAHLDSSMHEGVTVLDDLTDVVCVAHPTAQDDLLDLLQDRGVPAVTIGDAMAPRSLFEALFEAHSLGRSL